MDQVKALLGQAKNYVECFASRYETLNNLVDTIHKKVPNIEKAYISLLLVASPVLLTLVLGYGHVIVDLVAFIYPFSASIKAIQSENKDDDTFWLTYWLVFAIIKVIEACFGWLLNLIPFYFLVKLLFFVWCYHSRTRGVEKLYSRVIKPFLVPQLDKFLGITASKAASTADKTDLTIFIDQIECVRQCEDVLCEVSIESADASLKSSEIYKTKHASGETLSYKHTIVLSLSSDSISNDFLQVVVKTQPTFNSVLDSKILGTSRLKLSTIPDLKNAGGNFTMVEDGDYSLKGTLTLKE